MLCYGDGADEGWTVDDEDVDDDDDNEDDDGDGADDDDDDDDDDGDGDDDDNDGDDGGPFPPIHKKILKIRQKIEQKSTKNRSKIVQIYALGGSWGHLGASWKHFGSMWQF